MSGEHEQIVDLSLELKVLTRHPGHLKVQFPQKSK